MSEGRKGGALETVCRGIIVLASVLVPRSRRSGWREEWESEVWHHLHTHGTGSGVLPGVALLLRCVGAFPHALWIRGEGWTMDTILQDFKFAVRTLVRRPMFASVAVATLAVGIGGNTAVFSVVNAVLLRPLPLPNADRLVYVWGREFNGRPMASVSPPDFLDYRDGVTGFEEFAAYASFSSLSVYADGDRPTELTTRGVTHNYLDALGESPAHGRMFTAEETTRAEAEVAMISHGVWGRLFGFDREVLGTSLRLDGVPYTVVGVLPEGLSFPGVDVLLPLTFGADWYGGRQAHFLRPLGLLAEGATLADGQAGLDAVSARLEAAYPETNDGWYAIAEPLQSVLVGSVQSALLMLFAAIAFVLLIGQR